MQPTSQMMKYTRKSIPSKKPENRKHNYFMQHVHGEMSEFKEQHILYFVYREQVKICSQFQLFAYFTTIFRIVSFCLLMTARAILSKNSESNRGKLSDEMRDWKNWPHFASWLAIERLTREEQEEDADVVDLSRGLKKAVTYTKISLFARN
jgi:hypothetical protein